MPDYLTAAKTLFEYTQDMRRDFHAHPELGFQEIRTSGIVAKELTSFGLDVQNGVGGTGVVALLEGTKPGKVVLARADMDADCSRTRPRLAQGGDVRQQERLRERLGDRAA